MSQFNAIGEYGLNDVLTKRLTTPGGSNAPSVAPEIFPTLALESDRPEWGYLKNEWLAGVYMSNAAVAGQYSMFQLYLPSNARTIAVVTSIRSGAAVNVQISRLVGISGGLAGWSAVATTTRDFRTNGNGTAVIVEKQANVALPARFAALEVLQAIGQEYTHPIVITPGTALGVFSQVVNNTPIISVQWYERPAQPGELV